MRNLRILVFSATFGAGHFRAAEAVIEAMMKEYPTAEITHLDCGQLLSKTFNTMLKGIYLEMIKHAPRLWGKFYSRTSKMNPDSLFQRSLNKLGQRGFLKYIRSFQPDLIVCTYPTVAGVLARLRLSRVLDIPLVTVVTDYAVHSQWIHQGVDLYIVGCQGVYEELVARGVDPRRVKVTGIPVSLKFERSLNRSEIAARLGLLPDRPTILVMGGAYGVLSGIKKVCAALMQTTIPLQFIVVCGQNQRLFKSLDDLMEQTRHPVLRFGYVNNVEELMAASDIIITKAGGLIVSEALTKQLPLIIFKPIPGQEEQNAVFINRMGAGRIVDSHEALVDLVKTLVEKPDELRKMREAAAHAIPGFAAERAVAFMMQLISPIAEKKTG
ncbi:MGDG synthase family glycosyltransferase [Candidatus Formimonas warabiya]|uniref:MGDG synthase family glycosyltransferase n=1 Tax=Formimonas warabiya TaxID=1761012 RepID=UPI0011D05ACB|nr:glycosyltransferase [Candidatus Formimonas warabiya]